jgi:hypothetical protein
MLLLFDPGAAASGRKVPAHGARGAGHTCFAVAEDTLDAWQARLVAAGVAIEQEASWPRGGRAFYFRHTAGNTREMAPPRIWGRPEVD